MDEKEIISVLKRAGEAKIIVFGDYTLDKYLYSDPTRDELSVETGLPAFQVHHQFLSAGVGGTITNNLRAMGAQVVCIGIVGNDGEGYALLKCLQNIGADVSHMVKTDTLCTCTYTKPMRKGADGVYHEANRFDLRNFKEPPQTIQQELLNQLQSVLDWADGVIITDQFYQRNLGALTDWLRAQLSELAKQRDNKIFFADSRSFAGEYSNMIVKCNNIEYFSMLGEAADNAEDLEMILASGKKVQEKLNGKLFVTCGKQGIIVFDKEPQLVPAFSVAGDIDIVGAGDATNAGIVLGLVLGLSTTQAARLACCISSITIQQVGTTGTATPTQVEERLLTGC